MNSVVIKVPSGYVNAGLLLVIEVLIINFLVTTIRKNFESFYSSRVLANGEALPLRQFNFLGFTARRDKVSVVLACFMLATVVAFGIIESGVNGETQTSFVNREGFVYGGDNTVGINITSGYPKQKKKAKRDTKISKYLRIELHTKPIGKQKDIMEKCSIINYMPISEIGVGLVVELFLKRAALSLESDPAKLDEHTIAINVSNSRISCLEDEITVQERVVNQKMRKPIVIERKRRGRALNTTNTIKADKPMQTVITPTNCMFESFSAAYEKMVFEQSDSSTWNKKEQLTIWDSDFSYTFLKRNTAVEECLKKRGYTERYIVLVETDKRFSSVITWDIHLRRTGAKSSYRIIQAEILNRHLQISHDYEVHSNITLAHSILLAILVSSRSISREFPYELREVFYSNTGSYDGVFFNMGPPPVQSDVIFGQNGTQNPFVKQIFQFETFVQATRFSGWSMISFCLLAVSLILLYLSSLMIGRTSRIAADPMSSDWLGSALLQNRSEEIQVDTESMTSLQMIDSLDKEEKDIIILDMKNPSHYVNVEIVFRRDH